MLKTKSKKKVGDELVTKDKKICSMCTEERIIKYFYKSYSPLHADQLVPICKKCLAELMNPNNVETIKDTLRKIDRPFMHNWWEGIKEGEKDPVGVYFRTIALPQNRQLTWADSRFENNSSTDIKSTRTTNQRNELSTEKIAELEDIWGYGFTIDELVYFERKYNSLVANYPIETTLHSEALRTYCIYKVRAELETAKGNVRDAKEWANLAQKQGEIAKVNLNKLTKSDLSQGLDGFSQLARMVEQAIDIIPILPKFIERPQDKIDLAMHSFINYERRLNGMPDVEYSDIYNFYQKMLREYLEDDTKSSDIKKHIKEIEIDSKGKKKQKKALKKKILFYDVYEVIKQQQLEEPDNVFIQNLHKWVEFISWARLTFNVSCLLLY